ncbi:hypothetical protein FRC09_020158, partial [Ceratobasidium sp. 395]
MPKKKKTSLKPVARPFATTSIAKKVVETPPEESAPEVPEDKTTGSTGPTNDNKSQAQVEEYDADRAEIESLQILVDQQQAKAEREALRLIKLLEQESRTSKSLPRIDIDPTIRDRILESLKEVEVNAKLIPEPEDKVLPRLAVTYGTLRGIGLPVDKVEECLRAIPDIDIDSALEWLTLNGDDRETDFDNRLSGGSGETLSANGASEIPEAASPTPGAATPRSVPTRIAAPSTVDSDDEPGIDIDVNTKWARTKTKLHMLKFGKPKGFKLDPNDPTVQKLESRLEALQSDYEFRKKHAEYTFRELQKAAEATALEESLRRPKETAIPSQPERLDTPSPAEVNTDSANEPIPNISAPEPSNIAKPDVLDQHSDEEGGFFGHLLDEMPSEVTTTAGDVVRVYELAFPKNWNGATPKSLFKDYVTKLDRYTIMSYRSIGGVTRVARAAVQVRWRGKPGQEWIAPDACPTIVQAEHYAAMIALHSLSCPIRAGFVGLRSSATPIQPSSIRSLPPSAQDLWKELELKRKQNEDDINRRVWSKLRSIIEPKLAPPGTYKGSTVGKPATTTQSNAPNLRPAGAPKGMPGLKEDFERRKSSVGYQEMLPKRNELPIASFRSKIIESLDHHQVIVLSGETGCGKSTQLPAYILEDQLSKGLACRIYCTEPRRISAISLAQRVSRELGEPSNAVGTLSSLIGYSVRLESNITRNTRLAFVTNGIALRMLESGSGVGGKGTAFDEITHIIIDEVHERSIESDFLLIVLKSLMHQRPELKIVLMSATVDAEKVSTYFGGPSRTFPVQIQFLEDAVEFAKWTIDEDSPYAQRKNDKFSRSNKPSRLEWSEETAAVEEDDEDGDQPTTAPVKLGKQYSKSTISTIDRLDERRIPYDLILRLLEKICLENSAHSRYSAAVLVFLPGLGEIRQLTDVLGAHREFGSQSFRIYPLHSALPSENQTAVFDIPPPGVRKIVVSTNIAETGVTIPDITCVIDSGKHKEMRFDEKRQTSRLIETTIARSNAAQRRGRAGRVQEGLCFHLFTKSRHDNLMVDNPLPEILRLSLADLALRIKIMNVEIGTSVEDVLSRALDPPSSVNIQRAVNALIEVKALTTQEQITGLGRQLSKLPMDVHLGKFLLQSVVLGCLDAALTICATLNAKSPFLRPFGFETQADAAKIWRRASANGQGAVRKFCRESYLSYQNLQQIEDLRQQFMGYLMDSGFINVDADFSREFKRIRFQRNRTKFMDVPEYLNSGPTNLGLIQAALTAGMFPKIISIDPSSGQMQTINNNRPAAFHPSSINFKKTPRDFGLNYLCYSTLMQSKKLYASETGPASDLALILLCGDCEYR